MAEKPLDFKYFTPVDLTWLGKLAEKLSDQCTVGDAPNIRHLEHAHFPPKGIDRNTLPASFRLLIGEDKVQFDLRIMVSGVLHNSGDQILVVGFLQHDQADEMKSKVADWPEPTAHWVAVHFYVQGKWGTASLSPELHLAIKRFMAEPIARARAAREEHQRQVQLLEARQREDAERRRRFSRDICGNG